MSLTAAWLSPDYSPEELLEALLDASLTGINLLSPLYDPGGELEDFALEYLNPAAQRMAGLPERPGGTLCSHFPHVRTSGVLSFYRQVFETGRPGRRDFNYQADGLDNYFHLAARRCGRRLVVSLNDTSDQDRSPVELALRESQAAEKAARAEAEIQRQRLHDILMQVPAQVAVNRGPEHVFELVNPRYQQLFPTRPIQGHPVREALPELEGQQFFELLDQVYQTGEPFYGQEMPARVDFTDTGQMELRYFDVFFQALRNAQGSVDGILNFAYDVTEQVRARQQVEALNQALDVRVQERTCEAQAARAEAEAQRAELQRVFEQAPVAIAIYRGPQLVIELANSAIGKLWGRPVAPLLGRPLFEALPDARGQGFEALFADLLRSGVVRSFLETPVTIVRKPGGAPTLGYYNFTYQPLPEAPGKPAGLIAVGIDVTEQVQARRELEAQQRKLYTLFEQAPAGICILAGPDLVFEFLNPGYQELLPGRELLGRPILEALPELAGTDVEALLRRVYETGETRQVQDLLIPVARPGGGLLEDRYFTFVYQARRDAQGLVNGILDFVFEVTGQVLARQRAEALQSEILAAARRQSQEREAFHQIFEQTPALIALLRTPGHRYEYVNPAYQRLFAGRRLVGLEVAEAVPGIGEQGFVALLDQVYQTGETYFGSEHLFVVPAHQDQPAYEAYFNFTYQAYQENGRTAGISIFAYEVSEQVRARQEREAQRQQLQELFMQAPAPIVILDGPGLVYQLVNPAYQQLLPGRGLLGKPMLEALPELAGSPIPGILDGVYRTGETFVAQEMPLMLARHAEGPLEEIYFTFTYQARRNGQGRVDGVLVFAYEVTAQVLARRKVEESEQQVRVLVEGAPFPIGVFAGPEFRIQLANQAILESWGKGPDVIGRPLAELLPELENQSVFKELNQVFTTSQPLHRRNQLLEVVMDGTPQTFYYNYSFTPLRDTQGKVYGILNTAAEVTDLVLARRRTEEAAAELRLLTAQTPAFLYRTDAAGTLTYVNEALFEWGGLDRARMATLEEVWAIVYPEDLPAMQAGFVAAVRAGQPWEGQPCRFRRHDGQLRWMLSRSQPFHGPEGQVAGHHGVTIEIHDYVELQRELTRTNADLDNFIYTASHDLKAPISNIEGLLQALLRTLPPECLGPERVQRLTALMQDSVDRFKKTIANLTEIVKLQKENSQQATQVNLSQVIREVLLDLAPVIKSTGAQVEVNVGSCPAIRFSEKNLRSVIYNLVSNGIKYRSPERIPRVRIDCQNTSDYLVLIVRDNGLGMEASHLEKLFSMFKRFHTHVEGSGIGLYMVKKMIENAGGYIQAESQVNVGSAFRVYFPS